ncbi:MAG: GTP-binding protein [Deltaproteobacteria bacterium]|nr:MAG: GTP-binding protein [Deltaproteobacteria bacterium]
MARQPLRNIGILAHIDAGKTTLTENLLHATGAIRYPGAVEHGSTATDWLLQEQERGITIASAAISCRWRDVEITIVDTPGHVDFTMEVERSLRVLDGVVLVISGPDGVQAQTETVWHQALRRRIPAIATINKLDRPGFEDGRVLADIRERLGIEPIPLFVPCSGEGEIALVDVVEGDVVSWALDGLVRRQRASSTRRGLSDAERAVRDAALERLIDAVASFDDAFAEEVLSGDVPAPASIRRALRRAMAAQACLPVLYGAVRFGIGVEQVADAIVDLLPAPDEVPPPLTYELATGQELGPGEGLDPAVPAAFVFKTEIRPRGERLVFVRVFSGTLEVGQPLIRLPDGEPCRITEIDRIMGGDADPVPRLETGMIGGLPWPRDAASPLTGETLAAAGQGVTFERIDAPQPVISVTVEARDPEAHERIHGYLRELAADDPSLVLSVDPGTGQTMLSGMGELHVALAVERAARDTGHEIRTGLPIARIRQIIIAEGTGRAEQSDTWGGRGHVAIEITARPIPHGLGDVVRYEATRCRRPDWREALEAGLQAGIGTDGMSMTDVVGVELIVTTIEISGSDIAPVVFRDAARDAVRAALEAGGLENAEPWVSLGVVVPEAVVGRLVGDLARRGARIRGSESRGASQIVSAEAPLARMIGFATDLRSMSGGRGLFTMEPVGYEPVEPS